MRPDVRTWVQAAITRHLRAPMPLAQTHTFLIRSALAQLLRYWRYEVPGNWGDLLDNVTYGIVAWQIKERAAMTIGEHSVDEYAPAVIEAINKGDWQSLTELPEPVWDWVRELTGLTRAEWEMVPEIAGEILNAHLECPRCKNNKPLYELARVRENAEPIALSSTGAVRFTCSRCGSGISLDLIEPRLPDTDRSIQKGKGAATAALLVAAGTVIYLLVRYL